MTYFVCTSDIQLLMFLITWYIVQVRYNWARRVHHININNYCINFFVPSLWSGGETWTTWAIDSTNLHDHRLHVCASFISCSFSFTVMLVGIAHVAFGARVFLCLFQYVFLSICSLLTYVTTRILLFDLSFTYPDTWQKVWLCLHSFQYETWWCPWLRHGLCEYGAQFLILIWGVLIISGTCDLFQMRCIFLYM